MNTLLSRSDRDENDSDTARSPAGIPKDFPESALQVLCNVITCVLISARQRSEGWTTVLAIGEHVDRCVHNCRSAMRPARIDAIIDFAYGGLILLAVVLIATLDIRVGLTFGLGSSPRMSLHVVWKMARFDPDWMTSTVQETVEEKSVERSVEETVGDTVEKQVEETVDKTVGDTVEQTVSETVEETVDKTVGDTVEKTVSETVEETVDQTVGDTVEQTVSETVEETVDQTVGDTVEKR